MNRIITACLATTLAVGCLPEEDNSNNTNDTNHRPIIIIYSNGGTADQSFNQMVHDISVPELTTLGYSVTEVIPTGSDDLAVVAGEALTGTDNAIGIFVGFAYSTVLTDIAANHSDDRLILIDSAVAGSNVRSVVFEEEEGSFLAGYAAAYKADQLGGTKVGFIGGMDIALIHKFGCGYAQGVNHYSSGIEVLWEMTGSDFTAWNNPERGKLIAQTQIDAGAKIIFAAAGGTGLGVYEQADTSGILAIGVDSNQNHLYPGTMFTSMVKNVAHAAVNEAKAAQQASWSGNQTMYYGVAEAGLFLAEDEHNASLYDSNLKAAVENVAQQIADEGITVTTGDLASACAANTTKTVTPE